MSYPTDCYSKDVLLFVNRANFSKDSLLEVLTMACGLVGGLSEHKLEIVFIGDGVTECLAACLNKETEPYMVYAKSLGVAFWADKYSLDIRGLSQEQLFEGCAVIPLEDLAELMKKSDIHLRL